MLIAPGNKLVGFGPILLVMDGKSCPEIAQWLYRDEETVLSWVRAFNEAGLPGLERAASPGRPAWLTAEQRTQLKEAVRQYPRDVGYHASVWTTQLVRHCLYTRFGIEYGRERVRQLLHALGFRLRRLRHRLLKATPEDQAAFVAELESLLAEWPEACALICVDEATRRRHPTLTAQWCLVDDVPAVPTGDDPTKGQVYGAVAPLTGRTHDHVSPAWGKREFTTFLQHLLVDYPGQRVLVIHDRGQQHKGAPVEAMIRDARGRLELKPQPAYSPELTPQERILKWLRRVVTHHHWFATLGEQIEAVRHCFRYLAGVKDQVPRLCGLKTPASLVASL